MGSKPKFQFSDQQTASREMETRTYSKILMRRTLCQKLKGGEAGGQVFLEGNYSVIS